MARSKKTAQSKSTDLVAGRLASDLGKTMGDLVALFSAPICDEHGCVTLYRPYSADAKSPMFPGDPVGLEAFVNQVNLLFMFHGSLKPVVKKAQLMQLGVALIGVWAERLRVSLGKRRVLFYLTGKAAEDINVRFHVERPKLDPWLDWKDAKSLREESARVYRLDKSGLTRLA